MKLIKFDTLYPYSYLDIKIKKSLSEIKKMNFIQMNEWLIRLRMNFSDFYTYNLRQLGWDANEIFILSNHYYIQKSGYYYFGPYFFVLQLIYKISNKLFPGKFLLMERLLKKIIEVEKPDIIFIREQSGINSLFWDQFRNKMLVVSRMECGIPKYWSPACFDLIFTNIKTYRDFFNANKIPNYNNFSGFDKRILSEIKLEQKIHDVVFVGGLGYPTFKEKTDFFETLITYSDGKFDFKWWGFKEGEDFDFKYPALAKHYKGITAGLDMFNIYAQSKIVLNDYGIAAGGQGMNQRIYEVMGIGTFLLTRESQMFDEWQDAICTFSSTEDCIKKIIYYLEHEKEREEIAKRGQNYVFVNFNYLNIMKVLSEDLIKAYDGKFKNS